jgi:ABC-2 type transport system permease protein
MKKILTVAKWEFIEKIRTRSFIISLILTPLIITAFSVIPVLISENESDRTQAIGIIDPSGNFYRGFNDRFEEYSIDSNQPAYILINLYDRDKELSKIKNEADSLVIKGTIEGVLLIKDAAGAYSLEYRSLNTANLINTKRFERAFNEIQIANYLTSAGIMSGEADELAKGSEINTVRLDQRGAESERGFLEIFFSSLIFIMLLVFIILSSGGMLIRSLVEEKSNRLIEIIVSSCKPGELLTGKMLGLSLLALVQLFIWLLLGLILTGAAIIPLTAFENILPMSVYFLLGFIFYTSLFVGIGSIVNTEQEAQQVTGYLTIILFIPILFAVSTIQNPDSAIVSALTYIPFTTPAIMLLKFNIKPVSLQEIIITTSIMLAAISLVISVSSKIFRIGILSYGKMPTFRKMITWMKED